MDRKKFKLQGSYSLFKNGFVDDGTLYQEKIEESDIHKNFRYNNMKESHEKILRREQRLEDYCKKNTKYEQLFFLGKDFYPALFKKKTRFNKFIETIRDRLKVIYGDVRQVWKRNRKRYRSFRKKAK